MLSNRIKYIIDPEINYPVNQPDLPFSDYIKQCTEIVSTYRLDLDHMAETIIQANTPFELVPPANLKPDCGVLLIHGLFDSPLLIKDIATHLQSSGFLARSVLLPGHGTVPGALLNVHYEDWAKTVEYGVNALAKQVKKIYLVGYSTGATLALLHALRHPNIAGLVLIAPPFKINSSVDFTADWHRIISGKWSRAKWLRIAPENDYARYQSLPFNAIAQVNYLAQQIKTLSKTQPPTCPMLMIVSENDEIVSSRVCFDYFKHHANEQSRLIWYAPTDTTPDDDARIIWRPTRYPDMNIMDFSHIALPIEPNNSHYGMQGDSLYASHVDPTKYLLTTQSGVRKIWDDLLYRIKLTPLIRRRLSFNPDFSFFATQISHFLSGSSVN